MARKNETWKVSNIMNFYKDFLDRSGCQAQLLKDVLIVVIVREHCKKLRFLSSVSCACMGAVVALEDVLNPHQPPL